MKTMLIWLYDNMTMVRSYCLAEEQLNVLKNKYSNRYKIINVLTQDDFLRQLPQANVVLTWSFETKWYELSDELELIITPSAGSDWIQQDPERKIKVIHGAFHGRIIRESLLSMMLYFNNMIELTFENQKNRIWNKDCYSDIKKLFSQTVIIIGYGAIGRSCAELLKSFGCKIIGVKRTPRNIKLDLNADKIIKFQELNQYLPVADQVVAFLPSCPETNGIIKIDHFKLMKKEAYFYNFGRGNCYTESNLILAVREKMIKGAGLDVFAKEPLSKSSPLWNLPNVIIMPHASGISSEHMTLFVNEVLELNLL